LNLLNSTSRIAASHDPEALRFRRSAFGASTFSRNEEGIVTEMRQVKGCCPLDCQDSCSWVAHVDGDRVVRVEGAREHPFTRGALCAKVNDYPTRTYAPDRLLYPLRRTGPKGSGEFARVSWDEAIETIARRFASIIAEHGPEALLPHHFLGTLGVVQRRALMRLFHALGASGTHGSVCGAAGNVLEAEGHPRGFDPEEIVHSRLVVLWGANLLTTSHHHWHFVEEARRRNGARIIAIDPIRTRTAQRCDQHLAILPGTDRFLAAGIARVLFEENLADLEFARSVAGDVDELRADVGSWTPERVGSVCGIAAENVVQLAREFGRAAPAVIRSGVGVQQSTGGEALMRSLSALAILGGHWKRPGGGLFTETYPMIFEKQAERPELAAATPRSLDMARLGETLTRTDLRPRVHGLMVWCANPVTAQPDTTRVLQGLEREDLFTVVLEHFLTDTARYADIVLPSTTQLEHFDVQGAWGHHYISVNNPAVPAVGEAKSHGEVMRLLAARMGLAHPALRESDEEIAASALPEDVELELLKAEGWRKNSPPRPEFGPEKVRVSGFLGAAIVTAPKGQLQLLTPKSHFFMNSSFANTARHRKAMRRPTLDMHSEDAAARGLADGDRVRIQNTRGAVHAWLRVTEAVRPGVVMLPGKWWSTAEETGAVANLLTPPSWSPGGQPAYNETFVEVWPAPQAAGAGLIGVPAQTPVA
jgi:anaerobic selenocysteine-containing dehydrogenase